MSQNAIFKRFQYVKDEDRFIDTHDSNRTVAEEKVLRRLIASLGAAGAVGAIQTMKDAGLNRAQLKSSRRPSLIQMTRTSYERLRQNLPLRKFYFKAGPVLYYIDEKNQVTFHGDVNKERFAQVCMQYSKIAETLRSEIEDSEFSQFYLEKFTPHSFSQVLFDHFISDPTVELSEEPKAVSWDPAVPAFCMLDFSQVSDGPTPNWDSFLSRMDYPETFKAYVWAAFNPSNKGRQCIWIQGEGLDGKSSAVNALTTFLGTDHVLSISKQSMDSNHFFAGAYGKTIAVYMDCKKTTLLRSEAIKSLLGKDTVDINGKFQNQFAGEVYCKLFVGSNYFPQINYYDNSERTRLLLVRVRSYDDKNGDSNFQEKLEAEMSNFLYKCRVSYEKQCPNNNNLLVPDGMNQNIRLLCSAEDSETLMNFVREYLVFEKGAKSDAGELRRHLRDFLIESRSFNKQEFSTMELNRVLLNRGVSIDIGKDETKYYVGVRSIFKTKLKEQKNE